MPKYTAQSPIQHDADRYEIGDTIELKEKAAEPLLAVGALVLAKAKKEKEDEKPAQ